ncbi:UxaA family hydrolase [Chengkuizengella axinellae]|uniref:Altronate dehydratase family protein n=1 Tax=Chengkuizengella axinellae TaxID=3064388 RepID=A0ABT9ITE3_9BACL|nr:altronate dehydratase family protein [Chengkuizengella sp. 2205SS18-9]MDP5272621.1 altronate dehydratase family protein [Chengkuizengella sp. 2205SS18-9]
MLDGKKNNVVKIHGSDSVAITLKEFNEGERIILDDKVVEINETIPYGHKIAIKDVSKGEDIIKFGYPIGHSTENIVAGSWIHSHNMKTNLHGELDYEYEKVEQSTDKQVRSFDQTFKGYMRDNGDVGIRNEIWIINTVGCINKTAELLANMANQELRDESFDGVFHFPHPFGCSQLGDDLTYTQKLLSNLVHHPNAAGVLVLGLGCENNYIELFKKVLGDYDNRRVKFLEVQAVSDEMESGLDLIEELVQYAKKFTREDIPVSKLKIGLKCGGSDGFSGITANPLVGRFADHLISKGGTAVLTEVPEMFGAETILMNRAKNEETFSKIVDLVNDFKRYFIRHDQVVYENPSPGNKKGGITTLEEKSLGCIQKGGFAEVNDVVQYGERVTETGLNLLQGPGNDLVSVTALAASGAHIVLFTTGRGTPFGGPVPTVKISTNTGLYARKKNWIDFDAGQLLDHKDMNQLSEELFDYVVNVASGDITVNNEFYGFKEIAIFKDGVMM